MMSHSTCETSAGVGIAVEIGKREASATPNPIATPIPIAIPTLHFQPLRAAQGVKLPAPDHAWI